MNQKILLFGVSLKSGKRFSDHCAIKFSMNLKSLGQATQVFQTDQSLEL